MYEREAQVRRDSRLFAEMCSLLLKLGHHAKFHAHGQSMQPNLRDGDSVVVAPIGREQLQLGDLTLVENAEGLRVHRVAGFEGASRECVTSSDTSLETDPAARRVFGKVVLLERDGREQKLSVWRTRLAHPAASLLRRVFLSCLRRLQNFFGSRAVLLILGTAFLAASSAFAQTADLALTQAAAPSVVPPGSNITYSENVTNNGPNAATTPVVYQQTPPNSTFVSIAAPANWTCSNPGVGNAGQVICTLTGGTGTLANGGTASFTFVAKINAATAAGTTIVNSANVTSQTTDSNGANNATLTSTLVEIAADADLGVTLQATPTPVFIYSPLSYQIQIKNYGLAAANGVTLTDPLPTTLTFVSATPSQGSCSGALNVTCNLGVLAAGATATVTIAVTTPANNAPLTNTATVTTTSTDPVSSNNSATNITVVQPIVCATPGKDGAAPAFSTNPTIVNAYYPPAANGTLAAGSTTVTLGAAAAGGAQTAIAIGDLLLIIQMQDAQINSTNTSSYGDGLPGNPTGWTALNNSGNFEFVTATKNVAVTGGALTFKGTGSGGGILNTYTSAAYSAGVQGQRSYQVIRIPQYTSVVLSSNLSAMAWNGATGGVLAIDASSQLTLGGTVAVDGLGFRAGGGRILTGGTGANTDYVTPSTDATNGPKGEGIAGTPAYVLSGPITALTQTALYTGSEGLPNGSQARGAPGNAGGGGTDGNPPANDQNSGGGGGGNGGSGGYGGYGWNSASINGGTGGNAFPANTGSLVLGGGGGAGTSNNGSYYLPATGANGTDCGANCTGIYSSGAAGGGLAILHAGSVVGTGTITANGLTALDPDNDGAGGGGAGGSIRVLANSGGLGTLAVSANGGAGGNPWIRVAPGQFEGNRHGPGGGGGGGVIFLSSTPASASVLGGVNGGTTQALDAYGATPGAPGFVNTGASIPQTPGTQPGAYCASTDLSVTNSAAPPVIAPAGTITYSQSAINNGSLDAVNAIFDEATPANTTFQSFIPDAGWTCSTPAPGTSGTISCTNPDFTASTTSNFTLKVTVGALTTNGTQIVDVANITSGTVDPNLTNNSATAITTVGISTSADLQVTNTASAPTVIPNTNFTTTGVVTNNGPASATSAVFTEAIPANTTFRSLATPPGWACTTPAVGGTGTITCTAATVAAGAVANFPVILRVTTGTASGTVITLTGNITSSTPDSNPSNNIASASIVVGTNGQADLAVTATGTPDPVSQGNTITYKQSITNNGPSAETNATFTDTIPANTTLFSFTPPANWTCNTIAFGGTGTLTCTLNAGRTIATGASVSFPLIVQVNTTANLSGSTITNTPTASSTVGDPNPSNNSATVTTVVAAPTQADVRIVKTAAPEPVNQNTNLAYTLIVTNGGPAVAQGVSVSDVLPAQVSYSSASASQGSCGYTAPTTTVTCNLGALSVGSSALITVNVTAITFSSSSLSSNTATVTSTTSDPNLSNNTSTAISTIQSSTAVDIAAFHAHRQSNGSVVLEWKTQEESRNLGFHVYREQNGGRQRITPSLIAGSALLLRGSLPQHAAKAYRWIDAQPDLGTTYWIEDLDINGTRTMHGPASVESVAAVSATIAPGARTETSPLLRELHVAATSEPTIPRTLITPRPLPIAPQPGTPRFTVADHNAVKIAVDHEGWYQILLADLFAAGLDGNADPRSLHLFAEGIEQPLLMGNEQKGLLTAGAAIEFYGTGIDTPFSADRIYWLVRENTLGKRIPLEPESSSGNTAPNSFPFTVVREDRFTYFAALLNGTNNDNFFGAIITSDPVDQDMEVAHLDPSSAMPITLDLTLQGANDGQPHAINVQLNGSMIGQMNFTGQALVTQTFDVEASLIRDGRNTVTLTALDGDNDVSLVQSILLHYPHTFAADASWLKATAAAGSELHVSGFNDAQVRVFDITDPLNITEIGGKITASSGKYEIAFTVPGRGSAERTLLAFSGAAISKPVSLLHHVPSFLDDRRGGSDVVVISHPDFAATLGPLVQLRESQGHRVCLVTTDQVYDEYNYGERSPFAIRSFLNDAALHWQLKPQAILLVGDASFDPRDYLGLGDFDFVPTRMIETQAFKTSSDDWFTDFQSTGYATIATGRLPVRTIADTQLLVSKIVNYEQGRDTGGWNGQALLVADQNVNSNFSAATVSLAATLPQQLQVSEILADGEDTATVHSEVLGALNEGSLIVDYQGHGAEQQWSFTDFFSGDDASALSNGGKLPVYILMDCLNGFFQDVYDQSLAESILLAPSGGGVAVWASSGFTEQPPQASMNQAFVSALAAHPTESLGQLILEAKSGTTDNDVRRTWILFGDPAMKLHFPDAANGGHSGRSMRRLPIVPEKESVCELGARCVKGQP
jgi:uncharacterized repeat protein (TIGR01451 family)